MRDEPYSPLQTIAGRLLSAAPPRLGALIERLCPDETYYFARLVKEYLPEHEREILGEDGVGPRIAAFAGRFRDRYFPLNEWIEVGDAEEYSELLDHIPLVVQSVDYDDYHELPEWRHGLQLMSFIVADPHGEGVQCGRVPLGESCRKFVSLEALIRVPDEGISRETLHAALDGSPYASLAVWADMLFMQTGNFFLDTDPEALMNGCAPEWDKETVQDLTRQWHQAQLAWQQVSVMAEAAETKRDRWLNDVLDRLREKGALHGNGAIGPTERAQMGAARVAAGPAGPPAGQARLF